MKSNKRLEVAILSSNLSLAHKINEVFKKLDMITHTYENASDFLNSLNANHFELCLIDIKNSKYQDQSVALDKRLDDSSLAFIYDQDSEKYLGPTYTTSHLGYVNAEGSIAGQIKNILFNYNGKKKLMAEFEQYKSFHASYSDKTKTLYAKNESLKESLYNITRIKDFFIDLETELGQFSFSIALSNSLTKFEAVRSYALLKLNDSGTKLINLDLDGKKSLDVPSIWVGKNNDVGIGDECISVASSIVEPFVDETLLCVTVSKNNVSADLLLILEISEADAYTLDWNLFEQFLSGKYSQMLTRLGDYEKKSTPEKSIFNLLDDLGHISSDDHLLGIDLSDISDFLEVKFSPSFNYLKFWQDMKTYMKTFFNIDDLYIVDHNLLCAKVSKDDFAILFDSMKTSFDSYDIGKYFSGISRSEVSALKLRVSEIPYSHFGLVQKKKEIENTTEVFKMRESTL